MSVGDRIREVRKDRGFSQKAFAAEIGVSVQAVSQWESGKSGVSLESMRKIAILANCDVRWLWEGHSPDTVFVQTGEDYSKIPVIQPLETIRFVNRFTTNNTERFDHYVLTDTPIKGLGFSLYVSSDHFKATFEIGDLLIFDTDLRPKAGDVVLASIFSEEEVRAQTSGEIAEFTWNVTLWRLEATKPSKRPLAKDVEYRALDPRLDAASSSARFGIAVGTLVERRTYRDLPLGEAGGLK